MSRVATETVEHVLRTLTDCMYGCIELSYVHDYLLTFRRRKKQTIDEQRNSMSMDICVKGKTAYKQAIKFYV